MSILIKEVANNKKKLRKFIHFPAGIHKDHHTWVPPIYMDEWSLFNPKKNKAFLYSDVIMLLAYKNGKLAGRIMGLINYKYNEIHDENHGRFAFMDCVNDQEVAHALISYVENWAKKKGMSKLIGPLAFSDKDPQGFLIGGYEHLAILDTACNYPYMVELIQNEGFSKKVDLNDYILKVDGKVPDMYQMIYNRLMKNSKYKIIEFKKKKELKPFIVPVLELMNNTYEKIYGYVPLTKAEMKELARRYIPILDPDFLKVVMLDNKVVSFVIGIPDPAKGLIKSKGYLFPFGIFYIFRAIKKSKHLVLLLGAVDKEHRDKGVDALMAAKTFESAIQRDMKSIESHLILETNTKMNAEILRADGKVIKKFRIFQKDL